MFRNYFRIAWRNLRKHRFYTLVTVIGLAIGLSFSFLIGGFVRSELSVNTALKNAASQYIITSDWKDPNIGFELATVAPLAKALKEAYPNLVADYYRFDAVTSVVSSGDKIFREGLQIGDASLLRMFGFPLLYGDAKTALNDPFSIVLTEEKARKYFGSADVIGQTLRIQSFSGIQHDFRITAVLKNVPRNSVTRLSKDADNGIFLPLQAMEFFGRNSMQQWNNLYIASFIQLQNGVTVNDLQQPITQLLKTNASPDVVKNLDARPVALPEFYRTADHGVVKKLIYTLLAIAAFILAMAVINFVNISVSCSSARMREIGVRKVMGGLRKQVIYQFLTESVLVAVIATALSLLFYSLFRQPLSNSLGSDVPTLSSYSAALWIIPPMVALVVGLLAGLYPALVLSNFKTVDSLKGKQKVEKTSVQKSLVALQFGTAMVAAICALVVTRQVAHFFSSDIGYNKEFVLSVKLPRNWTPAGVQHMETLRDRFQKLPQVEDVSLSYEIPNGASAGSVALYRGDSDSTHAVTMQQLTTDEQYASVYKIPLVAGNFFKTPYAPLDSSKVVLNEAAVKALGWTNAADAIGSVIKISGAPGAITVSGVTKDFHFGSMQETIPPIIFIHPRAVLIFRMFSFRIKPGNLSEAIATIQKTWQQWVPDAPFEYTFMDADLKRLYQSELQLKQATYVGVTLAFAILLLGVVGLVSLSIQKRLKEISIRKILGASAWRITSLFIKEFARLLLLAALAAIPVSYWLMQHWLERYAYRIALTPTPFLLALLALLFTTIILIGLQTVGAALRNPVKSLKSE